MNDARKDKVKRLKAHYAARESISDAWQARGYQHPPPTFPPLPDDLTQLRCEAITRAGTPCKRTDLYSNGRCKFHGGLSTGPKTPEGKERAKANFSLRWPQNPM